MASQYPALHSNQNPFLDTISDLALSLTCLCCAPSQLHYIHSSPSGSGSANPPVVSTVYAYIGTPPAQRQLSSLVWRLGPTHFLEEVLPAPGVSTIYELGPNYVGSFQAVYVPCKYSSSGTWWLGLAVLQSLCVYGQKG